MPAHRDDAKRRLVGIDPAEVGWIADRAADVGPALERREPGCERRGGAAGRSARGAGRVPGVVRRAEEVARGLEVGEHHRHVALPEEVSARRTEARDDGRVGGGDVLGEGRYSPSRGQSRDVVSLLDRHRDAVERADDVATRERRVRSRRGVERAIEVAHHDRVDLPVEALDAVDEVSGHLERADLLRADPASDLDGALEGEGSARKLSRDVQLRAIKR